MNKLFYGFLMGVMFLIAVCITYVLYLLVFDNPHPMVYNSDSFPAEIVKVGDKSFIKVPVDYCKYTDAQVVVTRSYVDGLIYHAPSEVIAGTAKGCHKEIRMWEVPYSLPSGQYYVITKSEFRVNPLATRTVIWQTAKFNYTR